MSSGATVVFSGLFFSCLIFAYCLFSSKSLENNLSFVKQKLPNIKKWIGSYQCNTTNQRTLKEDDSNSTLIQEKDKFLASLENPEVFVNKSNGEDTFFLVRRNSWVSLMGRISRLPEQPCWLYVLIVLEQHS